MEASADVYVYQPCNTVCEKAKDTCGYTPTDLENCIRGCTDASLGACQAELKALTACLDTATQLECVQGNPSSPECSTEGDAFGACSAS